MCYLMQSSPVEEVRSSREGPRGDDFWGGGVFSSAEVAELKERVFQSWGIEAESSWVKNLGDVAVV